MPTAAELTRLADIYAASYPPSLFTPVTPPTNVFPTVATAGTPGSFSNPLSPPATLDIPDDLGALQALGALGNVAAWATGEYVVLEDLSEAYWDGAAWAAGQAPVSPPPPPADEPPTSIDPTLDPADWTVDQVQAYIDNIADAAATGDHDPAVVAETQRVLAAELAGLNRSTLVTWLDHRYGVVHP